MKKVTFAILALMLAFSAHATKPGNNGGGNGGCGAGQTTNGCAPSSGDNTAVGGDGGTGIGIGIGIGQGGKASAEARVRSEQSTSVTVEGDSYRLPVSSALAPMIHNTANCAIGVSGGLQAATWGISGGSAYESDTCVTIEQSKRAESMGEVDVAREIMCSLPKYREARKTTGKPCSVDAKRDVKQTASVEYTDPLIRRRLGLPPLTN